MSKYKAGLHKDVSAIFNGASIPRNDNAQQSFAAPAMNPQNDGVPKTPVPEMPAQIPPVPASAIQIPPAPDLPAQIPPVPQPAAVKQSAPDLPAQIPPVPQPAAVKQSAPDLPAQIPPVPQPAAVKQSAPDLPAQKPAAPQPAAVKPSAPVPPAQKPLAPSHMTPNKPRSQPAPLQQPKEALSKPPKAKVAPKIAGKSPWQKKLELIQSKLFAPKPGVSSTKQKAMTIMIPVLCIVMVFVFIRLFSAPSKNIKGRGKKDAAQASAAASGKIVEWKVPEPYPATLRDPMQFGPATGVEGTGDASGIVVKGIVFSKTNPCAVIGDKIAHQGDKVLGVLITKINENSVEFEVNGKKWTQKVQR